VERIGVERTWRAVESAGAALVIESATDAQTPDEEILARLPPGLPRARVVNKIDLVAANPAHAHPGEAFLPVSAKTGAGMAELQAWLLDVAGWKPHGEGIFMARQRHLEALQAAARHLEQAEACAQQFDLQAEELRLAHLSLGRITGVVSADELLGEIFGRFCIGK
jgi:tRNA modification GTPase